MDFHFLEKAGKPYQATRGCGEVVHLFGVSFGNRALPHDRRADSCYMTYGFADVEFNRRLGSKLP